MWDDVCLIVEFFQQGDYMGFDWKLIWGVVGWVVFVFGCVMLMCICDSCLFVWFVVVNLVVYGVCFGVVVVVILLEGVMVVIDYCFVVYVFIVGEDFFVFVLQLMMCIVILL